MRPMSEAGAATAAPVPTTPGGLPPAAAGVDERVGWFADQFRRLEVAVGRMLVGKPDAVRLALTGLVSGGHVLVEDVPGVGKTVLARALASAVGGNLRRVQGTSDLLPPDLTGMTVWNPADRAFDFRPGPVFANVVLVDEINRLPPRTQAALLEAMEERQVTVDGDLLPLPRPFLVIATQNPVEADGTYELAAAPLDRFALRVEIGYPERDDEVDVLLLDDPDEREEPVVIDTATVSAMASVRRQVHVSRPIAGYCVDLCRATRASPETRFGVSPRGARALRGAGQVAAATAGRSFVTADDIRDLVPAVLGHRVSVTGHACLQGGSPAAVIDRALDSVPVPRHR